MLRILAGVPRFQQEQERGEYLPASAGVLRHGIRTQGKALRLPLRRLAKETSTHGWSAVEGRLGVRSPQSRGGLTAQNETPEPGAAGFTPNLETTVAVRYLSESMHTGAHCGATSMTSSAQPALVVFDLDACCWYPEMYQLWVRGQIANPGLRTHVHGSR